MLEEMDKGLPLVLILVLLNRSSSTGPPQPGPRHPGGAHRPLSDHATPGYPRRPASRPNPGGPSEHEDAYNGGVDVGAPARPKAAAPIGPTRPVPAVHLSTVATPRGGCQG